MVCSYIDDIYEIAEALLKQDDIKLITQKDYITAPKPNGYRSLHLLVTVPVFFADHMYKENITHGQAALSNREEYMAGMEKGKTRLLELEQEIEEAQKELDAMVKTEAAEEIQEEELSELSVLEIFNKEKIQILVEKVFVYGSDAIDIVWKTSNPFE